MRGKNLKLPLDLNSIENFKLQHKKTQLGETNLQLWDVTSHC